MIYTNASAVKHRAINAQLHHALFDAVTTIGEALTEGRETDWEVIRAIQQLHRLTHMADVRLGANAFLTLMVQHHPEGDIS